MSKVVPLLEQWYEAASHKDGGVVRVDPLESVDKVLQGLYKARRESNDPALNDFAIVRSPTVPNELWIIRKEASGDTER